MMIVSYLPTFSESIKPVSRSLQPHLKQSLIGVYALGSVVLTLLRLLILYLLPYFLQAVLGFHQREIYNNSLKYALQLKSLSLTLSSLLVLPLSPHLIVEVQIDAVSRRPSHRRARREANSVTPLACSDAVCSSDSILSHAWSNKS